MLRDETKLGHLRVRIEKLETRVGLLIDELDVKGDSISVIAKPFAISAPSPASFTARVSQASVQAFLASKAPGGLRNFSVNLADGEIRVEAVARLIIDIRVKATCTLKIEEGTRLIAQLVQADVLGGAASSLVQSQLAKINPLFDAAELPLSLFLIDVTIEPGWVNLSGTIAPKS